MPLFPFLLTSVQPLVYKTVVIPFYAADVINRPRLVPRHTSDGSLVTVEYEICSAMAKLLPETAERIFTGLLDRVLFVIPIYDYDILDLTFNMPYLATRADQVSAKHGLTAIVEELGTHSSRFHAQLGVTVEENPDSD